MANTLLLYNQSGMRPNLPTVLRAFFGRLAVTPVEDPVAHGRLDVQLAAVAPRETIPAVALALSVVGIGLIPSALSRISDSATQLMAQLPGGMG